jgi:hypothetical protein
MAWFAPRTVSATYASLGGQNRASRKSPRGRHPPAPALLPRGGPGGNDLDQSGNLGLAQTYTVYNLPADGSTIYATLYSLVGGQWLSTSATYTSAAGPGGGGPIVKKARKR